MRCASNRDPVPRVEGQFGPKVSMFLTRRVLSSCCPMFATTVRALVTLRVLHFALCAVVSHRRPVQVRAQEIAALLMLNGLVWLVLCTPPIGGAGGRTLPASSILMCHSAAEVVRKDFMFAVALCILPRPFAHP